MNLRHFLSKRWRRLKASLAFYRNESGLPGFVPRGHFYSALPDIETKPGSAAVGSAFPGIDLKPETQKEILQHLFETAAQFDWPEEPHTNRRFYLNQGYFKGADSLSLITMMRRYHPARLIEVGSGFSSALMLDVNDLFLGRKAHFTFIDPHPDRLTSILRETDHASTNIVTQPVQTLPLTLFETLRENDILFIDSSHVSKTGSDVQYLFFEVLPRLREGVIVHVHDIYWPFDYPEDYIRQGIAWNEAYLLRAFLSFNRGFEVLFWTPYAALKWEEEIAARAPLYLKNTGASFWMRRIG